MPQTACRHEAQPPLFPVPPAPLHAGHEPGEPGRGGGRDGGAWRQTPATDGQVRWWSRGQEQSDQAEEKVKDTS